MEMTRMKGFIAEYRQSLTSRFSYVMSLLKSPGILIPRYHNRTYRVFASRWGNPEENETSIIEQALQALVFLKEKDDKFACIKEAADEDEEEKESRRKLRSPSCCYLHLKINIFHNISWSDKSCLKGVLEDN